MIDHGFDESVGVKLVEGSHPELRCKETGGWILLRGTSGTAKGVRGTFNDLLVVDELFSVDTFEPEASLTPTLSTRHKYGSATLMASTAPLEHSVFLAHKLDVHRGRANTSKSDLGFWEWAAGDDDDPADPAVWYRAIPGLAYGLISESFIASQFEKTPLDVFKREFLNIAAPSAGEDSFVSLDTWREVEQPPTSKLRATAPVWLGIDACPDQSMASVVAADPTGVVELAERRTGVDWIVDWVAASFGAGAITGIALLAPGPLAGLVDPLRAVASRHQVRAPKGGKLQVPLLTLTPARYAVACQQLLGSLHDRSVAVVDSCGVIASLDGS